MAGTAGRMVVTGITGQTWLAGLGWPWLDMVYHVWVLLNTFQLPAMARHAKYGISKDGCTRQDIAVQACVHD